MSELHTTCMQDTGKDSLVLNQVALDGTSDGN